MNNENTAIKGNLWLPNRITNILPFLDLTGRQWQVVWLIIRLTYGCGGRWAKLRLANFTVVNISPTHIRQVINPLIKDNIIIWEPKEHKFRINEEGLTLKLTTLGTSNLEQLKTLIGKHLKKKTSQKGNTNIPKEGSKSFPKEEDTPSQNGNNIKHDAASLKEIIKSSNKYKVKSESRNSLRNKKFNPEFFVPKSDSEQFAFELWNDLEPDNPESFYYYKKVSRQLDFGLLLEIKNEVLRNTAIKNKGAGFVMKVEPYLKDEEEA